MASAYKKKKAEASKDLYHRRVVERDVLKKVEPVGVRLNLPRVERSEPKNFFNKRGINDY